MGMIQPVPPRVNPDSPNVRKSDPIESHQAADRAVSKKYTLAHVIDALRVAKKPLASDAIWDLAHIRGFHGSHERVRTVLAEERGVWFEPIAGGRSPFGRPCRLWTLKEWGDQVPVPMFDIEDGAS